MVPPERLESFDNPMKANDLSDAVRKNFATGRTIGNGRVRYDPVTTARFWSKVDVKKSLGECWVWTGSRKEKGYGRIKIQGQNFTASRVAWEMLHGKSLGKMAALHRCDRPECCNPFHLYAGTVKDNADDARFALAEHEVAASIPRRRSNKLDRYTVAHIKAALAAGLHPELLAESVGVHVATITRIRDGHTFANVRPREEQIAELRAMLAGSDS